MYDRLNYLRKKIAAFIEQVEMCEYECIAGPLENNITYTEMKEAFERTARTDESAAVIWATNEQKGLSNETDTI